MTTENLINAMDINYEATKNESRPSTIGGLQSAAIRTYPTLKNYEDSFFLDNVYFTGEKIDENDMKKAQTEFNQIKATQSIIEKAITLS